MKENRAYNPEFVSVAPYALAGLYALTTMALDFFIHQGGMSDPVRRAQVPELIRNFMGNSFPAGVAALPYLFLYSELSRSRNKHLRALSNYALKFALASAIVMQFDIEHVTALDTGNPEFLPDFTVGFSTSIAAIIAGKSFSDLYLSNPSVVEIGETDQLFDQRSPFRSRLATSVDQLFGYTTSPTDNPVLFRS